MRKLISAIFLFCGLQLFAQSPELLSDLNVGAEGSYAYQQTAYLGDAIILTVNTAETGRELAILKNGEFAVLKDINPGLENGDPRSLINFNGQVYFSAYDEVNGFAIWKTDGTEAGTVMDFDPGESNSNIRILTVAENGNLYYNHDGKIFKTDGNTHEEVFDGANLGFLFTYASPNYCKYKDGIAFIVKNSDDSFSLYHINDDEAVELHKTAEYGFFDNAYAIVPILNGLAFNIEGDDADNLFVYDESQMTTNSLSIEGSEKAANRMVNIGNGISIAFFLNKGIFALNGEDEPEFLLESNFQFFGQGDAIANVTRNGKAALIVDEGTFGDNYLMYTDGTNTGTEKLEELRAYQSNMIRYGRHAFFADKTSNGFDPVLYQVDLEEGSSKVLYEYDLPSNNTNSIKPIGVQNSYLYYFSNLNPEVGEEMYRFQLDNVTSTDQLIKTTEVYKLIQKGSSLLVKAHEESTIQLTLLNGSGQIITNKKIATNQFFDVDVPNGLYHVRIIGEEGVQAQSVFIAR